MGKTRRVRLHKATSAYSALLLALSDAVCARTRGNRQLTHPHPLERPESAWLWTSAEDTSPSDSMKAFRSSLVVAQDRLPTNTVLLGVGAVAGAAETGAAVVAEGWRVDDRANDWAAARLHS